MKKSRMLAAVAVAAVLGILITTTTTIGTGIFVQQAKALTCWVTPTNPIPDPSLCSNVNSLPSNQFNWQGVANPGAPYLLKEIPNPPNLP